MMAVSVTTSPDFHASAPHLLWEGSYAAGSGSSCGMPGVNASSYDVTADGRRFLMVKEEEVNPATKVVVVLNFAEEIRAKDRLRSQVATAEEAAR
jgi:hypothetical protein